MLSFGVTILPDPPWQRLVELMQLAERAGFDHGWTYDSHVNWQEPYPLLTLAAMNTERLHLGLNVTNPGTRDPTVTASAFATLQDVSNGRMVVGIGRGDSARRQIGQQPVKVAEFEAACRMLRELMNGRPVVWNDTEIELTWARGRPQIPLYVAGYGPRVLAVAGRVADGVIIQLADPEIVEWIVGQVRAAAEEAGRDPAELKVIACAPAHVGDDLADSCEQVRWFPAMVSNHVFDVLSKHDPDELPAALTEYVSRMKRERYDYAEHSRMGARHGEQITDETCERFCVLGPPEAHVEKLRRLEAVRGRPVEHLPDDLEAGGDPPGLRRSGDSGARRGGSARLRHQALPADISTVHAGHRPPPGSFGTRRLARGWTVVAVAGLAVFAAHTLLGPRMGLEDFFDRWLYNALVLLALAACVVRAWRVRAERGAWVALSLGLGSWSVAEILFDFVYGGDPPYPSVADAFYLAFYPACYVALMLLVRSRLSSFGRTVWLDGAMAAVASAALGAVFFDVALRGPQGSEAVIVTNLAYPLGDILLLSAVVGVFVLIGFRPDLTWALIGVGLAVSVAADWIFLFQSATDSYTEGTILDALWPASLLLLSAAAWQEPRRLAVPLQGRPLIATPLVCGLAGLGILTYDHFHRLNVLAVTLAGATIVAVIVRTVMTFRENARFLELVRVHAVTDSLTGLGNRRLLVDDLARALEDGAASGRRLLAIFDLDGFKLYNDTFGHPAGDALLARIAAGLETATSPLGSCYRLGGDEFCVLADVPPDEVEPFLGAASRALGEEGEGFTVTASFGAVLLPDEASTSSDVLRLADQRLYAQKRARASRGSPHEMLLEALYARQPDMRGHTQSVAESAVAVGSALGLTASELEDLHLAARLHDVGKLAIPDAVLQKPGPLEAGEWAFVKEHTVIGERILAAVPTWRGVGKIVRGTHERWDGAGYPDRVEGTEIPLAARIIAVCDAYSAMTSERPYRRKVDHEVALDELRRCSGTQFDPEVVTAFCAEEAYAEGRSNAA